MYVVQQKVEYAARIKAHKITAVNTKRLSEQERKQFSLPLDWSRDQRKVNWERGGKDRPKFRACDSSRYYSHFVIKESLICYWRYNYVCKKRWIKSTASASVRVLENRKVFNRPLSRYHATHMHFTHISGKKNRDSNYAILPQSHHHCYFLLHFQYIFGTGVTITINP